MSDLRYALRSLLQAPGFTLAAVLTLGLGVGLSSAIGSVVYGVLLRPLDLPRSDRLYTIWQNMEARGGTRQEATGRGVFTDWRSRNRAFAGVAAFMDWPADLTGVDPPENVAGGVVSHEYFSVLGIRPALGRGFLPHEETEDTRFVVVLSHELWARRFGRDPAILGQRISVSDTPYTVVGVLPAGFRAPLLPRAEIWSPLPLAPPPEDRGQSYVRAIGRLREGFSPAAATADMERVASAIAADHPAALHGVGVTLLPARDAVAGTTRKPLLLLLAAASLVLLVACLNVSNLILTRVLDRRPELAVRTALGARRGRLAGLCLLESFLLALAAAAAGLLLGWLYLAALRGMAPAGTPRLDSIRLDGVVAACTLAAAVAAGLAAGLLPSLWLWRRDLLAPLREAGGASRGLPARRLRALLVGGEIAASIVLLIGTGTLLRTLAALSRVDPGFRTERIVLGRLTLAPGRFPQPHDMADFLALLEERLRQRREIAAVGIVSSQPLADGKSTLEFQLEGRRAPPGEPLSALYRGASPGYFRTVGLPLQAGRPFAPSDTAEGPQVVLVSASFVRRFLSGRDPLGQRLRLGAGPGPAAPWRTVVGVVADVHGRSLDQPPEPEIWAPMAQRPSRRVSIVARASGAPAPALGALQAAASAVRAGQVVAGPVTMEEVLDRALSPRRFTAGLVASFAAASLLLAAVGLFAVAALAAAQRRREIAIRQAIGAGPAAVTWLLLRWSALLLAGGILAGLAGSLAARRAVASLLYGVQPMDGPSVAAAILLVVLAALPSSLLPAWRAGRTDPATTLRAGP
ncbi:MAG TPA: ABC transporter permease [Thermoanaerobaculia bacterium]|nr:ABC transporter permease [Thermoanaerobaculia bacterium]